MVRNIRVSCVKNIIRTINGYTRTKAILIRETNHANNFTWFIIVLAIQIWFEHCKFDYFLCNASTELGYILTWIPVKFTIYHALVAEEFITLCFLKYSCSLNMPGYSGYSCSLHVPGYSGYSCWLYVPDYSGYSCWLYVPGYSGYSC